MFVVLQVCMVHADERPRMGCTMCLPSTGGGGAPQPRLPDLGSPSRQRSRREEDQSEGTAVSPFTSFLLNLKYILVFQLIT